MARVEMPPFVREMLKFGVVGGMSLILDTAVLNLSFFLLGNDPRHRWIAVALGYAVGTVNGYFLNSRWTFRYSTKGKEARKLGQFAVVSGVGLFLTEMIVVTLANKYSVNMNLAKWFIATPTVFFWNYAANKLWTFKHHADPE